MFRFHLDLYSLDFDSFLDLFIHLLWHVTDLLLFIIDNGSHYVFVSIIDLRIIIGTIIIIVFGMFRIGLDGMLVQRTILFLGLKHAWIVLLLLDLTVGEGRGLLFDPFLIEVMLHELLKEILRVKSSLLLLMFYSHLLVETFDFLFD
jgi:hypothetical protein